MKNVLKYMSIISLSDVKYLKIQTIKLISIEWTKIFSVAWRNLSQFSSIVALINLKQNFLKSATFAYLMERLRIIISRNYIAKDLKD